MTTISYTNGDREGIIVKKNPSSICSLFSLRENALYQQETLDILLSLPSDSLSAYPSMY